MTARAALALAGAVLAVLTVAVLAHPGPLPGEAAYVRALQRPGEPVPTLAELVRLTTSTEAALVLAVGPAVWAIARWGRTAARPVVIVLIAMLVVQPLFKEVVDRPRPTEEQVEVRATSTSESYPSGHSLSTTAVWGVALGVAARRGGRALAVVTGAPIAATFLAGGVQGVHWPSDAIAGTIVGATAAWLALMQLDATPDRGSRGRDTVAT